MPSFRSGLRSVYRVDEAKEQGLIGVVGRSGTGKDCGKGMDDYKRRGNSLPTHCNSVSIKVLPGLRHSATNPDLLETKTIPTDVIETDYLFSSVSDAKRTSDEETERRRQGMPTGACQKAGNDSQVDPEACDELRKAILDGFDQRMVPGRRNNGGAYNLLMNSDLLDRVSLDIVRMSLREPSGLSGCRLRTRIERLHSTDMDLGCVRVDQGTKETFEIVLSLKECENSSSSSSSSFSSSSSSHKRHPTIRNFSALLSTVFNRPLHRPRAVPVTVHVGDAYQLEKIKLHHFPDGLVNVGICNA